MKNKNIYFLRLFLLSVSFASLALAAQGFGQDEYPGEQDDYNLGYQAGMRGEENPCVFAGLICSDAYYEGKQQRRQERVIYEQAGGTR